MSFNKTKELKEVAKLFAKLGVIAFGGPSAHISMMQEEVVTKRKRMDVQHFLDTISATNMIPGPKSTEMAIHIGYHPAGWKGLLVAGNPIQNKQCINCTWQFNNGLCFAIVIA